MNGAIAALVPVFAVIALGYGLRRARFVADAFWTAAERITFYVFFPALLISGTAKANLAGLGVGTMAASLLGGIGLVLVLVAICGRALRLTDPAYSSLVQSAIRPNVYVAFSAAAALFGCDGLTAVTLCIAIVVPAVNAISVLALVRHGTGGHRAATGPSAAATWRRLAVGVGGNPLILACALGFALNSSGIGLPPLIGPLLEILGQASLAVGLLAVGAGLEPSALRRLGPGVAAASALKLVALPLTTWLLARALGIDGPAAAAVVVTAAVPVSATAYVMARQMGGDATLMAGAITATTLAAMLTMPLLLSIAL